MLKAELYENTPGKLVFSRAYITGIKENTPISVEEADTKINPILSDSKRSYFNGRRYPELKHQSKAKHAFIVDDTETVLINNVHVPYAASG